MKKIILLLFKEGTHSGYCLFEWQILNSLGAKTPIEDWFTYPLKKSNSYIPSQRVSYYRSFKRLIELGLVERTLERIDVAESALPRLRIPKTREFKCFSLTNKGMKEARKIRKQISETIDEFQNLL